MKTVGGKLAKIVNIDDMRLKAQKRLPRMIFDFIDGGAEDEISRNRNRDQFKEIAFRHNVFVDVGEVDQTVELFGHRYSTPFGISPTGLSGLVWPKAEALLASLAGKMNTPFCLSTVSSVRLEEVATVNDHPKWFQLYIFKDRDLSQELTRRAWDAGYRTLVITADCAIGGNRERDPRNDFTLPFKVTVRSALDVISHPSWLLQVALNGAPKPENMVEAAAAASASKDAQGLVAFMDSQLDPTVTWEDVEKFVTMWKGNVIIKGILSREDALRARDVGADGIIVSNHGGRQLDGAISPLMVLPEIVEAVGNDLTILCDSGFRRGTDIVKAIALGAKAVLIGRPTLFGIGAAGEAGGAHVLNILKQDVARTMTLLGCATISDISPDKVVNLFTRKT